MGSDVCMKDDFADLAEGALHEVAQKYDVGSGEFPELPSKDSTLQFMRDVVDEQDALSQAKTANLSSEEAGFSRVSVSDLLNISSYADSEGLGVVRDFLERRALVVSGVSLGRDAKLLNTLFTVRRETRNLGTPRSTTKKNLFGETKVVEG